MTRATRSAVFDYRLLRFIIGVIALFLPVIVYIVAGGDISSISASYYTGARDYFVGMLFIVAAFLLSYNGHFTNEGIASKVAAVAAAGVALFPTSCRDDFAAAFLDEPAISGSLSVCSVTANDVMQCPSFIFASMECSSGLMPSLHYLFAAVMFGILAYFCLGPFSDKTKTKGTKFLLRRKIYQVCGWGIILSFVIGLSLKLFILDGERANQLKVILIAEWAALWFFAVAWLVSGKMLRVLADDTEKYPN